MLDHPMKAGLDVLALASIVGAWAEYVPVVVAILGGIWYVIQIAEWAVKKFKE